MTKGTSQKIAVIGDWHLAFVTSAVLADCGHQVSLIKPLSLNSSLWTEFPPLPVTEPGLEEMILKNRGQNRLSFENAISASLIADWIWLAVDTPINERDEPQLEPLLVIADEISAISTKPKGLIVSSQIPLGFCSELARRSGLSVTYVPENLRLGKGIETFLKADRTVIGSDTPGAAESVRNLMLQFSTEFLLCNSVTAEMVKHANNAFLATSISFANEFARIGEKFGVDSLTVGRALKLDKRIGPAAYVIPGLGFAGGTLPRDLRVLQQLGLQENIPTPLVDAVLQVNENTTRAISEIVFDHVLKYKLDRSVLILGYTYKADTNTLRRSLSLDVASDLHKKDFSIYGLDPTMNKEDLSGLVPAHIKHFENIELVLKSKAHVSVILLMTARPEFQSLDWSKFSKNSLVLDTQNFLNADVVIKNGLAFKKLWAPAQNPSGVQNAAR